MTTKQIKALEARIAKIGRRHDDLRAKEQIKTALETARQCAIKLDWQGVLGFTSEAVAHAEARLADADCSIEAAQ